MTVNVRQSTPDDVPALAELAAITFPLACPPGTTEESMSDFIAANLSEASFLGYLADASRAILVADDDGALLGYTMLVFAEPSDPDVVAAISLRPTVELSKVYVHPDGHGRGLAAPLMAATRALATERGASGIWLGVNQQNGRAIRFSRKSGFEVVGDKTFLVGGELHDDHVMESVLAS